MKCRPDTVVPAKINKYSLDLVLLEQVYMHRKESKWMETEE
jgi:hypothetical protein